MRITLSRALRHILVVLLALACALPNVLPGAMLERLPNWYASNQMTLGLDLRGGSYLLLGVDVGGLLESRNQRLADTVVLRLREARLRHAPPRVSATGIDVELRDKSRVDEAAAVLRSVLQAQASRAWTLAENDTVLRLELRRTDIDATVDDAVTQSLEVVRRRLDESGLVEPGIARQGRDRIEVQLPGVTDPQQVRALLGTTAKMDFYWLAQPGATAVWQVPSRLDAQSLTLEMQVAMAGKHVRDARVGYDQQTAQPKVLFRLDDEGAQLFGDMTRDNIGRRLAVVLDGEVITAPVIRSMIGGGSGEISGGFTSREAAELAVLLRAGALPADLQVLEERTVGPNLGSDAIRSGVLSGILGGLLVLACMLALYGGWGFIAWLGLGLNFCLIIAVLSLLRGTLTLPGIAGLILSIGMAVDANILINERIREESRHGESARQALTLGFSKAWSTIIDSNITTLIAVSLLVLLGSGPVRGFATTIGIGLLTSLFTTVSLTRLLMEWRLSRRGRAPLRFGGLGVGERLSARFGPGGKVIDFMRAGKAGLLLSAVLSTASLVLMVTPGLEYGVDFSGGALVEVQAPNLDSESLRQAFAATALPTPALQAFGSEGSFQLRLPLVASDESVAVLLDTVKETILAVAPDAEFPRAEVVGPRVSGDFAELSVLAVLLACLGMGFYLWLRFENHFALAAILTIGLDLTKTIGFFALTGLEFNLTAVAALLALIGYSVNDKVVVFDRVREQLRENPSVDLAQLLNRSITTTLTRTVLTSGSTLLAVLPMGLFGGAAVASFAWPLAFGIVVGTSSSIFIAAPILLYLGQRRLRAGLAQTRAPVPAALPEGQV